MRVDAKHTESGGLATRSSAVQTPLPPPPPPSDDYNYTTSSIPSLPELAMTSYQMFSTPPSNGVSTATSNNFLLSPSTNGTRRTSGGDVSSQSRSTDASPNARPSSPTSDSGTNWSSAVGHATTGGKSGRVIEKLMTDNDRLKRELKEQIIKGEELQRGIQMAKPRIDALQAENDNLTHARGVDNALLARRDRMITELKADLAAERKRREMHEVRSQKLETERDEAIEEKRKNIQDLTESEKHATTHANILETSHKQLSATYRARLEATRQEITALREQREEQESRLSKLDVVSDQMRQELERSRKVQVEMMSKWDTLSSSLQSRVDQVLNDNRADTEKLRALSEEMEEVVNKMRWVMNLKQNTSLDQTASSA
ncbi:unnamed protein product [Zymoseptoria tritici ST99CH_1A5]|uniref:SWI5-dependent HO expression protein 3 n=3 Tax=Zymoseptoria tritici TaxID=1047171 RepID=A0A1X7RHJ9_ZYMT9|nr:unnamed protein product [Zymoseptoria tritici ST99CH_3D7]SMR43252.1 unnamed protein product [Zymoseptoria tritici ST99CH_1E4]SMR45413.1 unnamed protein product [Zymoseptoria tritici ST99CH_3D1]SMY20572.1 unnamed protein product [Zymoseptoria tritici ST99CH_1A5]